MTEAFDVLVIGAGLSGVAAGYHLQKRCPDARYAILEGRDAIGGTWDLFRYPGIRSDSDMNTLGYSFRPWPSDRTIADGAAIRGYVEDTARQFHIDQKIRFRHRVERASWSSTIGRWTVEGTRDGRPFAMTCKFLLMCSGYFDYARGFTPELPGLDTFRGRVVHPQAWTPDIDYTGKRVVVIGSGATAVTLVPSLAERAAHVTMLQRSPSYVVTRPSVDRIATTLRKHLPDQTAGDLVRWKNVLLGAAFFAFSRAYPDRMRKLIRRGVVDQLGADYAVDVHFNPRYNPWDQRLCLVPDADLFRVIKDGKAEVVTDTIQTFDATGVALTSGRHLDADLIVTATGLRLVFLGGIQLVVDGAPVHLPDHKVYKGAMMSGVPNLAMAMGYTNASWTLKCELVLQYACRIIAHLDRHGLTSATPRLDAAAGDEPLLDFNSGYVQRALPTMPRQGSRVPWKLYQNYLRDRVMLRRAKLDDGNLELR